MIKSVYKKVDARIKKYGRGAVFVTRDFMELGSRAAVDEAFSRLTKEGVIRRLRRGLYDYPRLHPTLGPVSADPDIIAAALARKSGSRIQNAGARAANALGLSTQVAARPIYLMVHPVNKATFINALDCPCRSNKACHHERIQGPQNLIVLTGCTT